jgi:hypothetical protein
VLSQSSNTEKLIKEEKEYIAKVNQTLASLKMPLFKEPENYYDQHQLNHLHKDWADTRKQWPKLTELFYKMDKELFEAYQEMNCHIHFIEQSFKYKFRDPGNWRVQNPFKSNSYDWESSHLYIDYPGHGRCAIEKFQHMDTGEDMERDNNNWDNVDAFIGIQLNRPYKMSPPPEFLAWCQEKNLVPSNYNIPLANLTNWKEIHDWIRTTSNYENDASTLEYSQKASSATLTVTNSSYKPKIAVRFKQIFPKYLSSINFSITEKQSTEVLASVQFAFTGYTIETLDTP